MDNSRRTLLTLSGALVASWAVPGLASASDEVTLAVVVGKNSRLTNLSRTDLRRIFTSESLTDPDGQSLIPLNLPPHSLERVAFDRAVLQLKPDAVVRYWIDRKIRGGKGAPRVVDSVALLRRVVERLPGAIGYLQLPSVSSDVKVVRIDGRLPEDKDYPVRGPK